MKKHKKTVLLRTSLKVETKPKRIEIGKCVTIVYFKSQNTAGIDENYVNSLSRILLIFLSTDGRSQSFNSKRSL